MLKANPLSIKVIMLINIKIPKVVRILICISMIKIKSRVEKQEKSIFLHLSVHKVLKFHAQLSWACKKF